MKTGLRIPFSSLLLIFFFASPVCGQDIHFSQFFEAPLLRNPALAGIFSGDIRVQTVYRTQWNSVTVPYQTVSVNGEYKSPVGKGNDFLTFGGEILYDKAGTIALTSTHLLPALNFHKSLSAANNRYLSLGVMGGLVQRRLDQSKITTNSQFDGTGYNASLANGETFTQPSYTYFDGSVGMSFNSQLGDNADNNIFFGLAYHHFNKATKISFYSVPGEEMTPKWVGSAGLRMNVSPLSYLTFHADYSKQGSFTEMIGGALFSWKLDDAEDPRTIFNLGAFLRWKDALIPVAKIEIRPLSISVSYDANVSQLTQASQGRGGFELSLTYQRYRNTSSSSSDAVRCPRF